MKKTTALVTVIAASIILLSLAVSTVLVSSNKANATSNKYQPSEYCVYNVLYLKFPTGVSVAYNTDGTIKTC